MPPPEARNTLSEDVVCPDCGQAHDPRDFDLCERLQLAGEPWIDAEEADTPNRKEGT